MGVGSRMIDSGLPLRRVENGGGHIALALRD
jgi:hypothetical protein